MIKKTSWLLPIAVFFILSSILLSGCGGQEEASDGPLVLLNEQNEEVSLTNKDRATILFHFTEIG
ncbi:hypothetical protein [Bacillus sp. FJAT-45350]|uniref:hypothetical protein n=1 Tax=Bacillus sp. FJAT-45350 TaxID=2011014 RepID=UPI000BB7B008|nr:hypothetical protein [Bacillus sp. FJAT-45350]